MKNNNNKINMRRYRHSIGILQKVSKMFNIYIVNIGRIIDDEINLETIIH
jgi:hypothetical protein